MTTPQTIEEKRRYCAGLVGRSALDDKIKEVLLGQVSGFEEAVLDRLIRSLELEQMELQKIGESLKDIEAPAEEAWAAVEKQQDLAARQAADAFIADLIRGKINKN